MKAVKKLFKKGGAGEWWILGSILTLSLTTLYLTADAADPAPTCVEEQIKVQQLIQQVSVLTQQLLQSYAEVAQQAQRMQLLLQAPFQASQKEQQAAKAEEERLRSLLPKPDKPSVTSEGPPVTQPESQLPKPEKE